MLFLTPNPWTVPVAPAPPDNRSLFEVRADRVRQLADLRGAAFHAQRLKDNANNREEALLEAYARRAAAVKEATGVAVDIPKIPAVWESDASLFSDGFQSGEDIEQQKLRFAQRLTELEKLHPDKHAAIRAGVPVESDAEELTRSSAETLDAARTRAKDASGFQRFGNEIIGSMGAMFRDPVQIYTLAFGGGASAAKTVGGRVVSRALTEAAINGAAEAAVQQRAEIWRRQAGVPLGWQGQWQQIGLAAAFGGGIGGLLQGGGEVLKALGKATPATDAALARMNDGTATVEDVRLIVEAAGSKIDEPDVQALTRAIADDGDDALVAVDRSADIDGATGIHGTLTDFEKFDPKFLGAETGVASSRQAFFFSSDARVSEGYALGENPYKEGILARLKLDAVYQKFNEAVLSLLGIRGLVREGKILRTRLRLENPKIVDRQGKYAVDGELTEEINKARASGHDAVIFKNSRDPGFSDKSDVPSDVYAVFDHDKIDILSRHTDAASAQAVRSLPSENPLNVKNIGRAVDAIENDLPLPLSDFSQPPPYPIGRLGEGGPPALLDPAVAGSRLAEPATPEAAENAAAALTAVGGETAAKSAVAPPEGGLFDDGARAQLDLMDALPAGTDAEGKPLLTTHAELTAQADRVDHLADVIASCKG
jgi:hypothetical protein